MWKYPAHSKMKGKEKNIHCPRWIPYIYTCIVQICEKGTHDEASYFFFPKSNREGTQRYP